MIDALIDVREATLELPIFLQSERSTKSLFGTLLSAALNPPKREFRTILDRITFSAASGDRIGIVGRNGAGKSTLLRLLTGAYQPTRGGVLMQGTRQALLNISLGFNNEATVVENVMLRGTAMGIRAANLRGLMEPILEFAELEGKANHRLKTLSSGQRLRLGFSIATAIQQDIMIMDEWIGTGDASFVMKAKERMRGRVDGAKIVILASHNFSLLREVCNKGMLLEGGRMLHLGPIDETLTRFDNLLKAPPSSGLLIQ